METSASRYDLHADWFLDYTRDWGSVSADFLPGDLTGERVLDLACGYGQLSRALTARGAVVTGVDLSRRLIERAREIEAAEPCGVSYRQGDAATVDWWDGRPFDGVICNMALMDVDDLAGAFTTVAAVLAPGGWFTFSLFHPCFPGEGETRPSWNPETGYATEGWWTTGADGVRGHVGAHHRMLSTYLNAALAAGLVLVGFAEPPTEVPRLIVVHGAAPSAS